MTSRQLAKLAPALLGAAQRVCNPTLVSRLQAAVLPSLQVLKSSTTGWRTLFTSGSVQMGNDPAVADSTAVIIEEPLRKYKGLQDKELWHEAWMYEDRFGTAEEPIVVPSLEDERIIGVTDPEDDNLVVWGILRADQPPLQFIERGEYYVLQKVKYIAKVGDVLDLMVGDATEEAAIAK